MGIIMARIPRTMKARPEIAAKTRAGSRQTGRGEEGRLVDIAGLHL
jgi:hypothetical protein